MVGSDQDDTHRRGVAQSGSASGLGLEGRRFESYHPDHFLKCRLLFEVCY